MEADYDNSMLSRHQLGSKEKSKLRVVQADLENHPSKINVSVTLDGIQSRENIITCGISSTDTSQTRLWAYTFNIRDLIELESPTIITLSAIIEHIRMKMMKERKINLNSDVYDCFIVGPEQQDAKAKGAIHAKWRAVVERPNLDKIYSPCQGTPDPNCRIIHLFFGKKKGARADLANKGGSNLAVNMTTLADARMKLGRFLLSFYPDKLMPKYVSCFDFIDKASVISYAKLLYELAKTQEGLLETSPGTFTINMLNYFRS